ncbi:hypothetical protein HK100_009500 [Physocladia obscura]|uniref:E3 ubiquitin-protein ligase CHIP n=1 Tax=Physocladia obscura TaxID=109957 RepID=A0AAD5XKG1_9FUNG|nr:hypothetical protein HK100_009500 [Physocladia obscura]
MEFLANLQNLTANFPFGEGSSGAQTHQGSTPPYASPHASPHYQRSQSQTRGRQSNQQSHTRQQPSIPRTSNSSAAANATSKSLSLAEQAKLEGNSYFAQYDYERAITAYSVAIIRNPANPVYYSNRALCHLRRDTPDADACIQDCTKAIELCDSRSESCDHPVLFKLFYYKALALLLLDANNPTHHNDHRLSDAINCLKRAFDLSISQKSSYTEEIATKYRAAKALRFERADSQRRLAEGELHRYLVSLVQRDCDRQISQLQHGSEEGDQTADDDRTEIARAMEKRVGEIEALFIQADENSKKRSIPDAFIGKISFEIMTDPVISPPSGITYDRAEIVSHLQKIGKWDPLTRQPLHESELVPNLALKEVIEDFLAKNGWAFDY